MRVNPNFEKFYNLYHLLVYLLTVHCSNEFICTLSNNQFKRNQETREKNNNLSLKINKII